MLFQTIAWTPVGNYNSLKVTISIHPCAFIFLKNRLLSSQKEKIQAQVHFINFAFTIGGESASTNFHKVKSIASSTNIHTIHARWPKTIQLKSIDCLASALSLPPPATFTSNFSWTMRSFFFLLLSSLLSLATPHAPFDCTLVYRYESPFGPLYDHASLPTPMSLVSASSGC